MAKFMKVPEDPEVLDKQVEATVISTNAPQGKPLGWQEAADWQANLTLLKETGGIAEVKPLQAYFTNDYLAIASRPIAWRACAVAHSAKRAAAGAPCPARGRGASARDAGLRSVSSPSQVAARREPCVRGAAKGGVAD